MAKRKHFDAIGWSAGIVVAIGAGVVDTLASFVGLNTFAHDYAYNPMIWRALGAAIAVKMIGAVGLAMKNFTQFIVEEETSSATATTATGAEIEVTTTKTTTTPVDSQ